MRVIMDNGGARTHTVNDKAEISHEIEKKTELTKKTGGAIENQQTREIGGDTSVKPNTPRGSPSAAAQRAEHYSKQPPKTAPDNANVGTVTGNNTVLPREKLLKAEYSARQTPRNVPKTASGAVTAKIPDKPAVTGKRFISPEAAARRQEKFSGKQFELAPRKKYVMLENGVVNNGGITKRKTRTIYAQKPAAIQNMKPRKIKPQTVKLSKKDAEYIREKLKDGNRRKFFTKKPKAAGAAVNLAKKPAVMAKDQLPAQRPNLSRTENTGTEAAKLGLQAAGKLERGIKTAVNVETKTAKGSGKIAKRVTRKLNTVTSAGMKRTLRKQVKRTAQQATKKAARTAGKSAKKTAEAAFKAAKAAAKAAVKAVVKVVSLIVSTMPWSLIIIAAVLIILLVALMFGSMVSDAGGTVAGGGAWLVDDSSDQTPEEIYEGYKKYVEQAQDVLETQAKTALKSTVSGFCGSDTSSPRKIIEYSDAKNSRLFYPAKGADAAINALISQFGTEDHADYMSLLFVLMTREKQQADNESDDTIYDFDFTKEDFAEFMKTVNENTCRWGDTFVIKTAKETTGHTCPGANCETETIPGCECGTIINEDGSIDHFCEGHPYCPHNHTKLTVTLYTVKEFYGKDYPDIYSFTENEMTRYETSKAIIEGLLEYWEESEE